MHHSYIHNKKHLKKKKPENSHIWSACLYSTAPVYNILCTKRIILNHGYLSAIKIIITTTTTTLIISAFV